MNSRKLSAGDIIDARCTKCRAVTNHRIVAMVGDRVVRVECNTCHGVHNYHPPEENKMPATGKSRRNVEISPRKTRKGTGGCRPGGVGVFTLDHAEGEGDCVRYERKVPAK